MNYPKIIAQVIVFFIWGITYGQRELSSVYVWKFSSNSEHLDSLSNDLTKEFEKKLVNANLFRVLVRTRLSALMEQYEKEKMIISVRSMPDSAKNILELEEANFVFFGELYTESQSQEIRATIYMQTFKGELIVAKSVYLQKDKCMSFRYREKLMDKLMSKIKSKLFPKIVQSRFWGKLNNYINNRTYQNGLILDGHYNSYIYGGGIQLSRVSENSIGLWGRSSWSYDIDAFAVGINKRISGNKSEKVNVFLYAGAGYYSDWGWCSTCDENGIFSTLGVQSTLYFGSINISGELGFNGYSSFLIGGGFYISN